jgi:hypothetical protein
MFIVDKIMPTKKNERVSQNVTIRIGDVSAKTKRKRKRKTTKQQPKEKAGFGFLQKSYIPPSGIISLGNAPSQFLTQQLSDITKKVEGLGNIQRLEPPPKSIYEQRLEGARAEAELKEYTARYYNAQQQINEYDDYTALRKERLKNAKDEPETIVMTKTTQKPQTPDHTYEEEEKDVFDVIQPTDITKKTESAFSPIVNSTMVPYVESLNPRVSFESNVIGQPLSFNNFNQMNVQTLAEQIREEPATTTTEQQPATEMKKQKIKLVKKPLQSEAAAETPEMKKKRGRPVGSKNKTPEQGRSKTPAAIRRGKESEPKFILGPIEGTQSE